MSLDRIIATGRGKIRVRLEIEGWPIQPVTHGDMVQAVGDGRQRVLGLKHDGMKFGARLDLATGKIEAEGFRVLCVDVTAERKIIEGFRKRPTASTYLSTYISKTATTIPVFSTEGFASSGVIHIKTEAIHYTGKTGTSFTGCTRGYWRTIAQAHFTAGASASTAFEAESAGLAYPEVTDRATQIEGRRAWVWLYGDGDSAGGDGTQRWQGVCSTSPRFEGQQVSFGVDPPTAILKQPIGGDVVAPVGIRGIYYPWSAPFVMQLVLGTGAGRYTTAGGTAVLVRVVGHFESQEAFCVALTAAIAAATSGWGTTIVAIPTGHGFRLIYDTPASSPKWVEINDETMGGRLGAELRRLAFSEDSIDQPLDGSWVDETTGAGVVEVATSTRYTYSFASPVPRAYFGADTPWVRASDGRDPASGGLVDSSQATAAPAGTIYLGGLLALSDDMVMAEEGDPPMFAQVGSVDQSTQSVRMGELHDFRAFGPSTRWRFGRLLARGNVGNLIESLIINSPALANAGAMPLITGDDIAIFPADVDAALVTPAVSDRVFLAFGQDTTLEDLIGPELVAAGMHWVISTSGRLEARRARLAASTEAATHAIALDPAAWTGKKIVGGAPTLEEAAIWGFVSQFAYLTGYDVFEDEHTGPEVRFNNVRASSPTRAAKTLELAQRSIPGARFTSSGPRTGVEGEPTQEEVGVIARFWLGLLGGTYDVLALKVPATMLDAILGDAISVTSRFVPDDDGTLGITEKLGTLIGYAWEVDGMRGSLELLLHGRPIAGYAPEFLVTGHAHVTGDTWDIALDVAAETDEPLSTWLRVGDLVLVQPYNTTSMSGNIGATVVEIDDANNEVRVTFNSAWNPAAESGEWTLGAGFASDYLSTDNLARFAFVASDDGIEFLDRFVPARRFSP